MKSGSSIVHSSGRRMALFLVACALMLRLLVPAGWMPVANAHGVTLNWCSGVSHVVPAEAQAMLATALGDKAPKHKPAPDQPCAFAAATHPADTLAALPVVVPPTAEADAPALPAFLAFPGRGLAAPPPLSTGPPLLA
ncbi:hypothetical protein [Sphingomonas sp. UNC305MFCol5.2]|uniref:hypothetical protein n=1 Tax=Sphingomonas sp. UNC305MFCol5.2 TaxID=1449076 RepID=UPI00046FC3E4|nr:hypothetical protein [Sphingomonas sp. UNC305MFCol5.2]